MPAKKDVKTEETELYPEEIKGKKTAMYSLETPASELLQRIIGESIDGDAATKRGLINLGNIPPFSPEPPPVNGKEFTAGLMAFRKQPLQLAIACGKAQVRYIPLDKYIAMVENMHDKDAATIMLQNFTESDDGRGSKGQILGRINAASSAITIIQGVTGRIIRGASDIALFDVYYIDRKDLTSFYLAAKHQIGNADKLETMITTFDGWKAFSVPLDPLDPHAA